MATKVVFDTSVLIPALMNSHINHRICLSWLARAYKNEFKWAIPAHCLSEVYSGLTSIPSSPKIRPLSASQAIDDLIKQAKIIELSARDYQNAIDRCVLANLSGGIIFDALIVIAAEKFKCDCLLTYNKRDFSRLLGKNFSIIKSPS
ncbi:MAG: PIN domain-containing protein [Candidatus Ozemobacteraceae bacterium]